MIVKHETNEHIGKLKADYIPPKPPIFIHPDDALIWAIGEEKPIGRLNEGGIFTPYNKSKNI